MKEYNTSTLAKEFYIHKNKLLCITYTKLWEEFIFMDYEIMMNGNVKIGTYAPDFEANTTMGQITLSQYKGKWVVLFSHPGDFTTVWAYNLGKYQKCLIIEFMLL